MAAAFPRQSVYPGMASGRDPLAYGDPAYSSTHLASLRSSLSSLSQTVEILSHTNSLLLASVSDVARLSTVLTSKRHFDVVTEGTVQEAKRQIEDEIRPLLKELISRGEEGVSREEVNSRRCRNKVSQLTTRLQQLLVSEQAKTGTGTPSHRRASMAFSHLSQPEREEQRLAAEERSCNEDLARMRRRRDELERELEELEDEVERAEMEAKPS